MKIRWKIFKRTNFYYFKLTSHNHIVAICFDYPKEYRATIKGTCYVIDYNTSIRKIIKTLIPFLKYYEAIHNISIQTFT